MTSFGAPLACNVPQNACCNCGTGEALSLVETPLKQTRYLLLGGSEIQYHLALPYCRRCAGSATRFPAGIGKKLVLTFLIFWVLLLIVIVMPLQLASLLPGAWLPAAILVVSMLLAFGFYAIRKPVAPQTSVSQPVTLAKVKQKFSGEITGVTLGFSNGNYADAFEAINRDSLSPIDITVLRLTNQAAGADNN